jgi:hypothetical protein
LVMVTVPHTVSSGMEELSAHRVVYIPAIEGKFLGSWVRAHWQNGRQGVLIGIG